MELHTDEDGNNPHLYIGDCVMCNQPAIIFLDPEDMAGVELYNRGAFVQVAFPHWAPGKRELLITGTHEHCFEAIFADLDEDYEEPDGPTHMDLKDD